MKKTVSVYCSLSVLAVNACAMSALFTVFSLIEKNRQSDPGLAVWLCCLGACCIGLELFLRRDRSQRSVLVFCLAFFLLQLVMVLLIYGSFSGFLAMLIAAAMWAYTYYCLYEHKIKPMNAEKITKSFDLGSFVLVFLLFFCSVKGLSARMVLPLAAAEFFCIFALVLIRGGEERKIRSLLISASVVVLLALLAVGFVAVASGGIRAAVNFVSSALLAFLRLIFRAVGAVLMFILSLFPQREYELEEFESQSFSLGNGGDMSFDVIDPQIILTLILILGFIVAAGLVVYRILKGKRRIGSVKIDGEQGISRRKSSLAEIALRLWAAFKQAFRFRINCIKQRNTAIGLFLQLERRSRKSIGRRKEGESCREYLERLKALYPGADEELKLLADALDCECFGPGSGLDLQQTVRLRRKIYECRKKGTGV